MRSSVTPPTGNRGRNKAIRGRLPLPVSGSFDRSAPSGPRKDSPAHLLPPRPDRTRLFSPPGRGTLRRCAGPGTGPAITGPGALNSVPSPGRTWRVALVACGGLVGVAVACLRCGAGLRCGGGAVGRLRVGGVRLDACGAGLRCGGGARSAFGGWVGRGRGGGGRPRSGARVRVHEAQGADAPAAAGAHPHPVPSRRGRLRRQGWGRRHIRQPRTRARTAAATCRQPRARGRVTAASCRPARAFVPPRAARVGAAPPGRRGAPAPPARTNAGAWCPANYGHSGEGEYPA